MGIKISEIDYTSSNAYSPTDTIVYIPGIGGTKDGQEVDISKYLGKPTLVSSVQEFENCFGIKPAVIEESSERIVYDKSFIMAKQLVAIGMKVLYEVVAKADNTPAKTEEEIIEVLKTSNFWYKLMDRSLYEPRFITSGGYAAIRSTIPGAESIATNMLELAGILRGDCTALIDCPQSMKDEAEIHKLFNDKSSFINGSKAGAYATAVVPWGKFNITTNLDIKNSPEADEHNNCWILPGSFYYLGAYQEMLLSSPTWYAAAGVSRGSFSLFIEPLIEIGELASDSLQTKEVDKVAINPIVNVAPYGYRLYGNRTLLANPDSGLKAQSFLNIRNLCTDIKKTSYQACRVLKFEQNTSILWSKLRSKLTPLLDQMLTGQGIKGYKIVRVDTKEKAKLIGKIRIIPIESVEDFDITLELTDSLEVETTEEI